MMLIQDQFFTLSNEYYLLSIYFFIVQFTVGNVGVHECPDGYEPITIPNTCELASAALGIVYEKGSNVIDERSVCSQCGACSQSQSFLNNNYGNNARWICQIEGFATGSFIRLYSNLFVCIDCLFLN